MKAQPLRFEQTEGRTSYVYCEPSEATHVRICLPGLPPMAGAAQALTKEFNLHIPVLFGMSKTRDGTGCWSWNGDVEKPTLKPSILNDFRPHDSLVNHVFVTDGKVQFLSDCSHEFAGQTMDLLDVE